MARRREGVVSARTYFYKEHVLFPVDFEDILGQKYDSILEKWVNFELKIESWLFLIKNGL